MRTSLLALSTCLLAIPVFAKANPGMTVPIKTSTGLDAGNATFKETKGGKLQIKLNLMGLPSGVHGVHIHQKPLCESPDFKTAGPHFDPVSHQHENVTIGPDGKGTLKYAVDYLSLGTGKPNDILANGGTSIMIHEKADDMVSDPTGNAGNRIACGIITGPTP